MVSAFGPGMPRGLAPRKEVLGGKGAGLAEMTRIGLPVPPGLTITTEVCAAFSRTGSFPQGLRRAVLSALDSLESAMGLRFGDPAAPLLVSVRSGARVSMPGMMDTVLNLGLNSNTVAGLAERSGNDRFAWDAYRRFIAMYSDVVLGLCQGNDQPFAEILDAKKKERAISADTDLDADDLRAIVTDSLAVVQKRTGAAFPEDPHDQLWGAIEAVFRSWDNDRAIAYRRMNGIPDDWGTAVNVQAMVFGNLGQDSGTGVAFTRNPSTGEKHFYGEYLLNAQGEDVVAGIRTPQPIDKLAAELPAVHEQLVEICETLEEQFGDMQDFEFTIERGRLFMLQTRTGKRTGRAAVRIATDMVTEGRIDKAEALLRLDPDGVTQLLNPVFDEQAHSELVQNGGRLAVGLNAGPGAATGRIVFNAEDAVEWAKRGEPVILVRVETSPEDILGMEAASGILTQRGGMTSHAALVARQMGKVCVAGCDALDVRVRRKQLLVAGKKLSEGDWLSLDGTTGEVLAGRLATHPSEVMRVLTGDQEPSRNGDDARLRRVMRWADEYRQMGVRANADQGDQAALAVALGAEGIGLCRTEHMFFGEGKLQAVQRMILADNEVERRAALAEILPLQRQDFEKLFEAMGSRPVTIRTLDPPLHEFLPHDAHAAAELANSLGLPVAHVKAKIEHLHEANPMLGYRGCRLTGDHPEILETQARAVFEAAAHVRAKGVRVKPEIMIPLVGHPAELRPHRECIDAVAAAVMQECDVRIPYLVGTMIEVPRAALAAAELAEEADFFSFGTNDLTQTTLGISRDDSGSFLPGYVERGIYERDPFATLDLDGPGRLMRMAVEEGRAARPDIKLGICGEHGGDPATVAFCDELALDYVSCSPFRLPVARLAAAQAALRARQGAPHSGEGVL